MSSSATLVPRERKIYPEKARGKAPRVREHVARYRDAHTRIGYVRVNTHEKRRRRRRGEVRSVVVVVVVV